MIKQTRLAALRRYYNLSQKQMADLINVGWRAYINKENGVSQFKMGEMFKISERFDMPIEDIFLPNDFMLHEVK